MRGRTLRLVALAVLVTVTAMQAGAALGQITFGATLTVLRGPVSVVHRDGSAIPSAKSGLTLNAGDRVATVGKASALVTFFEGSELELGSDTTIAILDASGGSGSLVNIIIENILGSTVHRVETLTNPGSSYQILAGGTVTEVRGTTIGNSVDGQGNVTSFLLDSQGKVTFPNSGHTLHNGEACTASAGGDLVCTQVKGSDVWSTLADGVGTGDSKGTTSNLSNTPKSDDDDKDQKDDKPPTPETVPEPDPPKGRQQQGGP
jgi:hypothetical protein